jgi:hypothetical protein
VPREKYSVYCIAIYCAHVTSTKRHKRLCILKESIESVDSYLDGIVGGHDVCKPLKLNSL